MGLESATYISELVSTNPISGDGVNAGDDHLRLLKAVLQATLPGATASLRQNFVHILSSVAGTNTITASSLPAIAAYTSPTIVVMTPANTNTGATTLNVDSRGALDVFTPDGKACKGGELVAGIPSVLALDSGADDWVILSPANTKLIPFTQKTDNYTLTNADCGSILYFNCAAGKSLTLPGAGIDIGFWCKVRVNGANSIGVASSGTLTWFSGAAATAGSPRTLASDGSTGGATVFITNSAAGVWEIEGAGIS